MEYNSEKKSNFKNDLRRFTRIFVFVFIVVFVIINSGKVFGMFNYGAVYGNLFKEYLSTKIQENRIDNSNPFAALPSISPIPTLSPSVSSQPQNTGASLPISANKPTPIVSKKPVATPFVATSFIEIPKLGIKVPIVFQNSTNQKVLEKALKNGVVHYPTTSLPGQNGAVMIAGHSAPAGWKRNYDWAFSKINELSVGSEIFIYYKNQKIRYTVVRNFLLNPGAIVPVNNSFSKSLYLSTCWPPGQSKAKRLIVEAQGS